MKQHLKLLSLLLLITLSGCQVEEPVTQKRSYTNKKVYFKSIESLFQDRNFKSSFEKALSKKNKAGKTVMEADWGFTILDEPATIIYTDSLTCYTLLIDEKVKETPESISNLVIQTNNYTQGTDALILRYISNTPIDNIYDYIKYAKFQPINYNPKNSTSTGKLLYDCIDIISYECANGSDTHIPGQGDCEALPTWSSICSFYDDGSGMASGGVSLPGGGGGGGGGTSTGGVPSNGGSGSSTVMTSPISGTHGISNLPPNPCNSLKKITPKINSALNNLSNDAQYHNDGGEYGYSFQNNAVGVLNAPVELPHTAGLAIDIPVGLNIYGGAHTHQNTDGAYAMFSWSDVYTLYLLYKKTNPNYYNDVVFMLINEDGSAYAIKIDDFAIFRQTLNQQIVATGIVGDLSEQKKKADINLGTKYGKSQNLERAFLENFKSGGMSLYKATGNLTSWKKLSLPSNPNSPLLNETPCN